MSLLNTRSNILQFKWGLVDDASKTNPNDTSNEDIVKKTVETFNNEHKSNDFTKHFFARLQRIRWASKLPKSFTDDAIEHVLNWQKDQGYMEENPDRSAEEAIKPFFERYNFLSYDAELGRRRDACNRGHIDYEYVKQPRYDTYLLSDQVDKKVEKTLDSNGRNVAGAARQLSRDKINTNISSQVRDRLNMQVRNISKSYRDMQGRVRNARAERYGNHTQQVKKIPENPSASRTERSLANPKPKRVNKRPFTEAEHRHRNREYTPWWKLT